MTRATVSAAGETITVHIPLTFRKRGGRKLAVITVGGVQSSVPCAARRRSRKYRNAGSAQERPMIRLIGTNTQA